MFLGAIILLLPSFKIDNNNVVEARGGEGGGPCRVQTIDTLWVEPALGKSTYYSATLQINILFASDSTEEERTTLDLGSSLRVWTSSSPAEGSDDDSGSGSGGDDDDNDDDNNSSNRKEELSFEHFEQEQRNTEISMIFKTFVPYHVPSIEIIIEKDGNPNYCYSIGGSILFSALVSANESGIQAIPHAGRRSGPA